MNDDQLHRVLRDHPAHVHLPKAFNREVWGRIEAADSISVCACAKLLCRRMLSMLARPCFGAAALAACVLAGGWLGLSTVKPSPEAEALHYVQSIRP